MPDHPCRRLFTPARAGSELGLDIKTHSDYVTRSVELNLVHGPP